MIGSSWPADRRVLVDASAYYAAVDRRQGNYDRAQQVLRRFAAERWHLYSTTFVLAEVHALILNRLGRPAATAFLRQMHLGSTTLVHVTEADLARARDIIYQYTDKAFSLSDASSFAVIERLRIPYAFSFDRDFVQYGLQVLP